MDVDSVCLFGLHLLSLRHYAVEGDALESRQSGSSRLAMALTWMRR